MRATAPSITGRTASPSTARAINDRLALDLLHRAGPLTATQLKELTGLSRPTVADLVERLSAAGLVAVVGETGAERRGPNARLYGIVADRAHLAGVDVRTHSVAVTVADLLGRPLAEAELPVPTDDDARPARAALDLVRRAARRAGAARLHTVAVGAPGLVHPTTGALDSYGRLPGWHRELTDTLHHGLRCPVLLDNEVNLAAVAERRLGAAQDTDTFVLVWLGHGVGAAVMLDGVVRRGASGGAGEIGFLPVPGPGGSPSATHRGVGFHSLAGSAAVGALARAHGLEVGDPGDGREGALAAAEVVRAAVAAVGPADRPERGAGESGRSGGVPPATAAAFLDDLAGQVAIGAAAACAVLDPGCVVLGGEVGHAGGEPLAARVAGALARLSPLRTEVRAGTVGGAAVLGGAVLTALDAVQEELFGTW